MKISFNDLKRVYQQSIAKNNRSEGFFNVFIFRKVSILFSWVFASLNFHPNLVTTLSFVVNIFAGVLLLIDFSYYKLIAIILIVVGFILDMCDGEVARLTNKQSKFGAFYDPFLDRIVDFSLFFSIGVGFWMYKEDFLILILTEIYLLVRVSYLYANLIENGVEQNVKFKNGFLTSSNSSITKYVKWDGGFMVTFISFCIYLEFISLLFIILIFLYIALFVILFKHMIKRFK